MQTSTTRMLTTHVGSLPHPPVLTDLLLRQDRGEAIDNAELQRQSACAVEAVVRQQLEVGIDIGVVARRLCETVDAVGDRSRVMASVDCGFGHLYRLEYRG